MLIHPGLAVSQSLPRWLELQLAQGKKFELGRLGLVKQQTQNHSPPILIFWQKKFKCNFFQKGGGVDPQDLHFYKVYTQ